MFRRVFSVLLMVLIVLASIPINTFAFTTNQELQVRIEGKKESLFNSQITVGEEVSALDYLITAVGEEEIKGGGFSGGYYITGILGEKEDSNNGWMYYVKYNDGTIELPMVAVDQFNGCTNDEGVHICEEIVFFMASYSGASILTKIPKVTVENDGSKFTIKVLSHADNQPISDVDINISTQGSYKTDTTGKVTFTLRKSGTYDVLISKDNEYPLIARQHLSIVSDGEHSEELNNVIQELKNIYQGKTNLNAIETMAYNSLVNSKENYNTSLKIDEKGTTSTIAWNVMGSLGVGESPSLYVEQLVKSQDKDGWFVIEKKDKGSVKILADAITALDMAKAEYDEEKAVASLVSKAKNGHYDDVITTAYALRALLNHRNYPDVEGLIQSSIDYLKQEQLDTGGYDYSGMGNSPYSTGPVVQALVLANEDLSAADWVKGGRTLIDSLLACKVEDAGFEFAEDMGWGYDDPAATQAAFAALSDFYNAESMFQRFTYEEEIKDSSDDERIASSIEGLRDYFTSMTERLDVNWQTNPPFYRAYEALALNVTSTNISEDVEDLAGKFRVNKSQGTLPYSNNIIGLISSGKSTQEYEDLLVAGQQNNGSFKIGRVEQTEWAVIALDMAGASYDVEKAVNYIVKKNEKQKSVDLLAVALTALAPHKEFTRVKEFINDKLLEINKKQLATGGFADAMDDENSYTLSYVISALVANGINPLTNEDWIKGGKTVLDALLQFKKFNYFIYNEEYDDYLYKDEATEQAFIALVDLKNMESSYQNVQKSVSNTGKVSDGLSKVRNYLTSTNKRYNSSLEEVSGFYTWMDALAINHTSGDIRKDYQDIQQKISLDSEPTIVSLSESIMGIIASGQVLSNQGENYVDTLLSLQTANGEFKKEEVSISNQAHAIIALDMSEYSYPKEKAVSALVRMQREVKFENIDEAAWALLALSNHNTIDGVKEMINDSIIYLREHQSNTGGFNSNGCGDTPQSTGLVIQALIANGKNPLSIEWIKGKNTLVDSLLSNQLEDGTFTSCEMPDNAVDVKATQHAFAALADLYTGKSMYQSIEPEIDSSDVIGNTIREVKDYIINQKQYNYLQSMGLNVSGVNKDDLSPKLELREDEAARTYIVYDTPTTAHARNISGILSTSGDPRNYNNKDFIEILEQSQRSNGEFNLSETSETTLSEQASAIIALEMVGSEYNKKKAVDALIEKYESKSPSIYSISETIIALSFHKNMESIQSKMETYIEDLKEFQTDSGGFTYSKGDTDVSSEYISVAIQAIIAAGQDPLAQEYHKNGKSPLDALMTFKKDNYFIYDKQKSGYDVYTREATGMAFAALMDLKNHKSMYHLIKGDTSSEVPGESGLGVISSKTELYSGSDNPSIAIQLEGDSFTSKALIPDNWNFNTGATGLNIDKIVKVNDQEVTITFSGIAKGGIVSIQAKVEALAGKGASNEINIKVVHSVGSDDNQEIAIDSKENEVYVTPKSENQSVVTLKFTNTVLPKIEAVRGGTSLVIPPGTEVTSPSWNSKLQIPTNLNTNESNLSSKINSKLQDKKVDEIFVRIKVGGNEKIEFNQHVILTLSGMGDKEAGFIDETGIFTPIKKYEDSTVKSDDVYSYAIDNGDLIIKTKHFTEFLAYTATTSETGQTSGSGGNTNDNETETLPIISFTDLNEDLFGYKEIYELVDLGIITGYMDGTFKPNQSLIRGHVATLFVRALDLQIPNSSNEFTDLSTNSPFIEAANAVKDAGIFYGTTENTFDAKGLLTREQMASVLVRAFNLESNEIVVELKDLERVSDSHVKDIEILYQNGITKGVGNGEFAPKASVTRAQFAVFLVRSMNLSSK